jgi:hypothetical protein
MSNMVWIPHKMANLSLWMQNGWQIPEDNLSELVGDDTRLHLQGELGEERREFGLEPRLCSFVGTSVADNEFRIAGGIPVCPDWEGDDKKSDFIRESHTNRKIPSL